MRPGPAAANGAGLLDETLIAATPGRLGVAVSGGSDSVALACLMARLGRELVILTVDHGLRRESAREVLAVRVLGKRLGIPVHVMTPESSPAGSIQAWARQARYQLFAEASARLNLSAVATGHTLDDQAETFLLRLGRGSGVRGLSAMQPRTRRGDLTLIRPLLGARREALRAFLSTHGERWFDDPTNEDPAFARTRVRRRLPELADIGLTPERLAATAQHLSRAAEVIDSAVAALLSARTIDRAGAVSLPLPPYRAAHEEVRLRTLSELIQMAGGKPYGPDLRALAAADRAVSSGVNHTLGRALLAVDGDRLILWREDRDVVPVRVGPGETIDFDGRFTVTAAIDAERMTVAGLGPARAAALPPVAHRGAMATVPAIFDSETFVAAPTLGIFAKGARRDAFSIKLVRRSAPQQRSD